MTAFREGEKIVVLVPQRMTRAQEQDLIPGLVDRLLAREAKRRTPASDAELAERAQDLARSLLDPLLAAPLKPASVRWVTNQNTRWGSCTLATREIRISHRLAEMPAWVTDYVLVHELVHLVESTHSARFWNLVAAYPQADRARGFLEGWSQARGWSDPRGDADPDAVDDEDA